MVLSVSNSSFTGLWMASGVLPLITWLTLMAGASIVSLKNTLLAASHIASMKLGWEIVTSLSLLNTGTTQSFLRCSMVTSFVLASMKDNLFTLLDCNTSVSVTSMGSITSASYLRFLFILLGYIRLALTGCNCIASISYKIWCIVDTLVLNLLQL